MTDAGQEHTDLTGHVAVVTGASAGIGEAVARRLAARGMHLVLGARRLERVESLAGELAERHGTRCRALPVDVRQAAQVVAFVAEAEAFAGEAHSAAGAAGVHLLVNNAGLAAGLARVPTATDADEADWANMLETNVMGLLRVTRALLPGMVERARGHVISIGSLAGLETYEGGSVYCASKAAVRIISKAMRLELIGSGVRVCCINPGLVDTEFSLVRLGDQQKADAVYNGMTPLTGDEVARSVEWVAQLPGFMNIEELNLQPTDQASAQKVHRRD